MSDLPVSSKHGGGRRPPWSAFRAALEAEGFRPSKTRGQNFLLDTNCARAIAADAGVGEGDRVLEVGGGSGFLSVHLAELGVDLLVCEIEPRLLRVAQRFLAPSPGVRYLEADALAGKHKLAPAVEEALWDEGTWHLVSNLPYAIAGPLLVLLARRACSFASATVLVQREVALRLAARPGESAWGALTARLALGYRIRMGRDVGRQLFWPRPRVESAVCHLERRPLPGPSERELTQSELRAYDRLVDALFQQRRKTVLAGLGTLLGDRERAREALEAEGLEARLRPAELGPPELLALARRITS